VVRLLGKSPCLPAHPRVRPKPTIIITDTFITTIAFIKTTIITAPPLPSLLYLSQIAQLSPTQSSVSDTPFRYRDILVVAGCAIDSLLTQLFNTLVTRHRLAQIITQSFVNRSLVQFVCTWIGRLCNNIGLVLDTVREMLDALLALNLCAVKDLRIEFAPPLSHS